MRNRLAGLMASVLFIVLIVLIAGGAAPLFAGDAMYGRITAVERPEVLVLQTDALTRWTIRLVGVEVPRQGPVADRAREFVKNLVLDKPARIRFEYRTKDGQMWSRLFVGDPGVDVGLELVRNGLARRIANYDYKYHELSVAEREAKGKKAGLWATATP